MTYLNLHNQTDLNSAFDEFFDFFCLLYHMCFPVIKIKINLTRKNNWLSKGLKQSCKRKRELRFKYYCSRSKQDKHMYLKYNKLFKKCINSAKKINNRNYILKSKNICKATWKVIKSETECSNSSYHITNIFNNSISVTESMNIATIFNDHFISTTIKVNNTVINTNTKQNQANSMFLSPVSEEYVNRVIMSLASTTAVGYDSISTKIIKSCANS